MAKPNANGQEVHLLLILTSFLILAINQPTSLLGQQPSDDSSQFRALLRDHPPRLAQISTDDDLRSLLTEPPVDLALPTGPPERDPDHEIENTEDEDESTDEQSEERMDDVADEMNDADEMDGTEEQFDEMDEDEINPRELIESIPSAQTLSRRAFSARALSGFSLAELDFPSHDDRSYSAPKQVSIKPFHWVNPTPVSQPTYFDDVDLERYGHEHRHQTVHSGLRFAADVILLPFEICKKPYGNLIYQSGMARPGDPTCPVVQKRLR